MSTPEDRFERTVSDLLVEMAPTRPPERLIPRAEQAVDRARRWPRWLALIKEPPMRISPSVAVGSPMARVAAIMVATLLITLMVAGAGIAGSRILAADVVRGVMLPDEIPEGIESGTLDTPLGQARWVHLRGDDSTLPAELAPIPVPSGYVTIVSEDGRATVWRSAELIEWSEEPMPIEAERGELSLAGGTYWLATTGPTSLWRSQDTLEWAEVGLAGLGSPGPDGYAWELSVGPPLARDGVTIVPYTYSMPYRGTFLGLAGRLGRPVQLREIEPGLFAVRPEPNYRTEATIRFEDTGSGLRVTDSADGTELTFLDGISMEFIERWATGDEIRPVHDLGVLDGGLLVDVDLPDRMRQASSPALSIDGSGFIAYSLTPDGMLNVHRSGDGRRWTESDTIGDDPGEPTGIEYVDTSRGPLVVGFESNTEWTSTDGVTWEISRSREDEGMPFAAGSLYPAGHTVPWYGPDPGEDPGSEVIENTMWYQPRDGDPIAIDVSDLGFSDTPEVDSSGSGGLISASTLASTFSVDEGEGPRPREIWIITFDELTE